MERPPEHLQTPRLTLRRWVAADAAACNAAVLASIEHLRPWMPWIAAEPLSVQDRIGLFERWDREWNDGGDLVVGIFQDGVVVGGSGLHTRRGPGVLEIGYWVHVDHGGQGIATEASAALTTAAFAVDGIERVEIHHDKANVASSGVPRRLGYTLVDETANAITSPGEVGVDCRWVMSRDDWSPPSR